MVAANGSSISVLGMAKLEIVIDDMVIEVEMSVSEQIDEFIVGVEFLTSNGCLWDFPT